VQTAHGNPLDQALKSRSAAHGNCSAHGNFRRAGSSKKNRHRIKRNFEEMDSRPEARAKGNSPGGFRLTGICPVLRTAMLLQGRAAFLFGVLFPARRSCRRQLPCGQSIQKNRRPQDVALPQLCGKFDGFSRDDLALSPDSATVEASSTTQKEKAMNIEAQLDAIIRNAEAAAEDPGIGDENDRDDHAPLPCAIRNLEWGFVEIRDLLEYALETLDAIREEFQTKNDPREKAQAFTKAITLASGLTALDSGMVARLIGKRDVLAELLD
jgi:hypothetical protein